MGGLTLRWFDHWLKGEDNGVLADTPKVQYYTMGANSLFGDGRLSTEPPTVAGSDRSTYDPKVPVRSLGGGVCCIGNAVEAGSFDQRGNEARHDVLVYTSEPLARAVEVSGTVEITLYVGSDAKDTDFAVKLIDVHPDGSAYNIDETIQRARFREGYDREVFMQLGEVYRLEISPMSTSIELAEGHQLRIEVTSSHFPRFARNLNTGGDNWQESEGSGGPQHALPLGGSRFSMGRLPKRAGAHPPTSRHRCQVARHGYLV